MKVAHVITGLGTGGAEMILQKLVQSGTPSFRHSVISLGDLGTIGSQLQNEGKEVFSLGLTRGKVPGLGSLQLVSLLRKLQPDLIKGWMYHGNLAATAARALLPRKPPIVWSIHCLVHQTNTKNWLTRSTIQSGRMMSSIPEAIVYNSGEARTQHEAIGYSARRGVVIPNGFDTNRFRPDKLLRKAMRDRLGIRHDQVAVGLVARLHPVKDHVSFVHAASYVARSANDVVFVAAGRDVTRLAETMPQLRSHIEVLGPRLRLLDEQDDVVSLFNAMDINVLCSLSESFPNVLGEAMACGVPCIATDVGECSTIIAETGLIVRPQSATDLSEAVLTLASDAERRRHLGELARTRIESKYSLGTVVRIHERLWIAAAQSLPGQRSSRADA